MMQSRTKLRVTLHQGKLLSKMPINPLGSINLTGEGLRLNTCYIKIFLLVYYDFVVTLMNFLHVKYQQLCHRPLILCGTTSLNH